MTNARAEMATATLLSDGRVLIAGGQGNEANESAELYDPSVGAFAAPINMNVSRYHHTATLLQNSKILLAGGVDAVSETPPSSAELFNPATGLFEGTRSMSVGRFYHTSTLLPNGLVLSQLLI